MLGSKHTNPAVSRVWLLDFDGVLLRHPKVLQRVQHRVVEYVQQNTGSFLNHNDATRLNRELYGRYGHTHRGLKKLFKPQSTLYDFNRFVYEPAFIQSLYREFAKDPQLALDFSAWKHWMELQQRDDEHGLLDKVLIFTNSPSSWAETWLSQSPLHSCIDEILGSDHPLFQERSGETLLKPALELYERTEYYHRPHQLLYFMDDSPLNLEPVSNRPQWVPYWFHAISTKPITECMMPYVKK